MLTLNSNWRAIFYPTRPNILILSVSTTGKLDRKNTVGAKSYDGENAWSSINPRILSGMATTTGTTGQFPFLDNKKSCRGGTSFVRTESHFCN